MRKFYVPYVACLLLLANAVFGQTNVAAYSFSSSTGTYTPITGTTLWTSWDSEVSAAIPLGGSFTIGGVAYTTCYITANGWIGFKSSSAVSSTSTPLSSTAGTAGAVISAYANDGGNSTASGASPSISYANIGGASGEFVVQYKDHANWGNRSSERLNFQIRLNLATSVINIVYGSFTPSGSTSTSSEVGIRGNSTTWSTNVNNLMINNTPSGTTCNWSDAVTANSNSSTMLYTSSNTNISIPNGLTYSWTPQTGILPVRTFSAVTAITSNGATLSWTAPTGATQYNVQYRALGSCIWTNFAGNPVASNSVTLSGLTPATVYQVRVQATNGTNSSIWSHIPSSTGSGNGYTTTGTFTTTALATDLQALQLQSPVLNAVGCYNSAVPIIVRIRNAGTAAIDFSTNNATVSASVSGPNSTTFAPVVINSGSLAAGSTQDVTIGTNYNLSGAGTYTFNASVTLATPDGNSANNSISPTVINSAGPAILPQRVDFSGYNGNSTSLNAASPGWVEGSGAVTPNLGGDGSFTNTTSTAQLAKYGAAAKMNLYSTNNGWIVSPKFIPTANHEFSYKAAVVNYNTADAANFGINDTLRVMVSLDCGATWTTIREFTQASNNGLDNSTNNLRSFTESLAPYSGQVIMVAIYARRTPTATTPDIDIVIDDLSIDLPAVCFPPSALVASSITANSASIDWTAPATPPVNYELYISTSNASPTSGTIPTVTGVSNPYIVSGLTANTVYYVWVRGNCGSGLVSNWSDMVSFRTLCSPITSLPHTQGFNALPISCWQVANVTGGANNWVQGSSSTDITGPKTGAGFVYKPYSNSSSDLISPPFDLAGLGSNSARINFWFYRHAGAPAADELNVYVNTTPTSAGGTLLINLKPRNAEAPVVTTSGWYNYTAEIPNSFNTAGTIYFVLNGTTTAGFSSYDLGVDEFTVELMPTCFEPTALTFSSITNGGVTVDWTAPAISPASYDIYYSATNTAPTAGTTPSAAGISVPYAVTGLTANTTYYVWVRGNCGGTDVSAWSQMASFTTLCNAFVTPTAAPETFATYLPSACWNEAAGALAPSTTFTSTTSSSWLQDDFANVTSPVNMSARINITGTTTDEWLITPSYDLGSSANKQLEFDLALTASGATTASALGSDDKFFVLISTDNGVTWSSGSFLREWNSGTPISNTGEHVVIDLSAYTGIVKFAFYAESTVSNASTDLFIDNFAVNHIPSCAPPTSVSVTAVTNNSASIDWIAPTTPPASYDVYYSTTNTAPTAGTTPIAIGVTAPYAAAGLTPNATYYVWVRGNCGTTNVSTWTTLSTSFTTLCNTVTTFSENFDAVTTPALPGCWTKVGAGGSLSTQSSDANSSPNTLYLYSSTTSNIGMVSLPPVSNLGAGTHRLKFNMRANFTVGGVVEVGYLTNPTDPASFTLIQSVTASALTYQSYTVVPSAGIVGQNLAFRHTGSPANSVLIDDVIWEALPACLEPTNVTATGMTQTGVTINWTAPAIAPASYDVYYSTTNTAPTGTTTPSATGVNAPYVVSGLTANTTYYVWVRGNCGSGTVSVWSQVRSFVTLCQPANVPYTQDFTSVTTPALPNCVSVENVNNDPNTWRTTSAVTGYSGNLLTYGYNSSAAANDWFYTAGLNLTAGKSYVLSYRFGNNSESYKESMKVAIGATPAAVSMTTTLADYPAVDSNRARYHSIRFTVPSTGVYYIGFQAYSITNQWNLYLDDISVVEGAVSTTTVNTCVTVTAPRVDGQSNNKWMSLIDAGGNIVGEINANGNFLGNVTVKVYRNSGGVRKDFYGRYYMDRNIEITPTVQPTSPVSVRLYFTAAELAALQAQAGSNVMSFNDISAFKNNDPCGSRALSGASKLSTVTSTFETNYVASFDVTSFSSFYLAASAYSVLPANILTFSGVRQGSTNNLKWTVAQEQDVLEYEIERSENGGNNWLKVGSVASQGNSIAQRSYSFADNAFGGLKQLYRLRQVDRNGVAKLSSIVSISSGRPTTLTLSGLFPNPAATKLNVLVDAPQKDNITIQVIDGVGRIVKTQRNGVDAGSNTVQLSVTGLSQGTYYIKVTCDSNCESVLSKFVKE